MKQVVNTEASADESGASLEDNDARVAERGVAHRRVQLQIQPLTVRMFGPQPVGTFDAY